MSPEFWAIIGSAAAIVLTVGSSINKIENKLQELYEKLYEIETLVGRIPGVEDYIPPDGFEWSEARKLNPDASPLHRRNWPKP